MTPPTSTCPGSTAPTPSASPPAPRLRKSWCKGVIDALGKVFDVTIEELDAARETVSFRLPRVLTEA
jgi:hypothetical protein